jgi:enoyl-CoA hydratase
MTTTTTTTTASRISVERDGEHVLLIGVNRPEKRNAFDIDMLSELAAAY